MKLKILLTGRTLIEAQVQQVTAEAQNGSFSLRPRHVDFTAALVPGLLSYKTEQEEIFLAVDHGILVKCGAQVMVSTANAVKSAELGSLRATIEEEFKALDEQEQKTLNAMSRIEAGFVRRFLEIQRME